MAFGVCRRRLGVQSRLGVRAPSNIRRRGVACAPSASSGGTPACKALTSQPSPLKVRSRVRDARVEFFARRREATTEARGEGGGAGRAVVCEIDASFAGAIRARCTRDQSRGWAGGGGGSRRRKTGVRVPAAPLPEPVRRARNLLVGDRTERRTQGAKVKPCAARLPDAAPLRSPQLL